MERMVFGTTSSGEKVERISFTAGRFHFSVLTHGATLYSFGYDDVNVILNHETFAPYENDPSYMGKVVGPYANRIANAEFSLDGKTFHLDRNNNCNSLHSGSACFGLRVWDVLGIGESSVTLGLATPSGLGGFPGSHECKVTYMLSGSGMLNIDYTVSSDARCPVAITNHAYFNLNGGEGTIKDHLLQIPAERYVAVDELLIPTGVVPVEGTDFDFRSPRKIGERRGGAYDNTFSLDGSAPVRAEGTKAALEVHTTEPGIQIYTSEFLAGDHGPFQGVCFETGRYPDTPNHPEYPAAYTDLGMAYRSNTSFVLEIRE